MAILGLDCGEKRIGVALADGEGGVAVPVTVINRSKPETDLGRIVALVHDYGVERIVVGMPLSLDGSVGKQAHEVLAFVEALRRHTSVPVATWDERFSSTGADSLMEDAGVKKGKRKGRRDAAAAAVILQGYLDRKGDMGK
ncbi:MAG: Holliday junction resolvase RuvX [Chloroflexota bacterium]